MAVPPAASKKTQAGAEAFAKFYWDAVGQATVKADSSAVRAMSTGDCPDCKGLYEVVDEMKASGQKAEQSSIDIRLVTTTSTTSRGYVIEVAGREKPVRVLNSSGKVVSTSSPGVFTWATELVWREGRWQVSSFKGV